MACILQLHLVFLHVSIDNVAQVDEGFSYLCGIPGRPEGSDKSVKTDTNNRSNKTSWIGRRHAMVDGDQDRSCAGWDIWNVCFVELVEILFRVRFIFPIKDAESIALSSQCVIRQAVQSLDAVGSNLEATAVGGIYAVRDN